MHHAPIPTIYVDQGPAVAVDTPWSQLQAGLGGGLATIILETPERRGGIPKTHDYNDHPDAKPADTPLVKAAVHDLLDEWRHAFEEIMNRRWSLCENPYAKAWLMPGVILLHEDPLGWVVDLAAEEIAAGAPLEEVSWALLSPGVSSNHAALAAAASPRNLPHKAILDDALTEAARAEGHDEIAPLAWTPRPSGKLDIVAA